MGPIYYAKEVKMHTSEFFGKEVLDTNAKSVGKVADIDVDMEQGVVNNVIVKTGFTKKCIVNLNQIEKIGDKVILLVREDELENKS